MNCLEFRRLVDTDPDSKDEDFIRHKAECESCAGFASRAERFSNALGAAARVEVPENLASRVLLRQSFLPSRSKRSRRGMFALAASMVAAVGLALSVPYFVNLQDPLAREIFTLIRYADYAMERKIPLGNQIVAKAIARAGLELEGSLEKVTFAGNCLLQQKIAGHLVMQGEKAPITVFLIREMEIDSRVTIRNDNLRGLVVPVDKGAIVVVGAPDESFTELVERITAAVRWRRA
ncbi:MAG TPA: DUF3379 family protein [Gammaproteobacteria bacterium]|nr:DUF3379 family protein [Gammaproteobacteria bacterium]